MALRSDDRLERVERDDLMSLGLSPQDFFLVSRVDAAKPTVDAVVKSSGLPSAEASAILTRLVEVGVLRRVRRKGAAATVAGRHSQRLRAALRTGPPTDRPKPGGTRPESSSPPAASAPGDSSPPVAEIPPPGSPLEDLPMAAADDPRVKPGLDLNVETQRMMLGMYDRLDVANHFEILQITPTSDVGQIRRAYHKLSRRFHPDAYYGKNIGEFREVLQDLFKAARGSHDLLVSSERREAYVARLLELELQKHQVAEAKSREAKKRRDLQRALERQQREAEEAKAAAKAKAERSERDRRRKKRMSSRLMGREGRESKAREHIRKAEEEIADNNYGAAAGLFRLAMDLMPEEPSYHRRWEETLAEANRRRALVAIRSAEELIGRGEDEEAAHFFEEAARAEPNALNLARAAAYLALKGDPRASQRAREAVQRLRSPGTGDKELLPTEAAEVHVFCAEAYMRLGQRHTAKAELEEAKKLAPRHPRLAPLLKKVKVG